MDGDLGRVDQKSDARARAKRRTNDEDYGSEFGLEFSLLVHQFVGSDGRRLVGRRE